MNCKEARALLSAYLDQELEAGARLALAGHLDSCPICRTEERELAGAVRLLHLFGQLGGPLGGDVEPVEEKGGVQGLSYRTIIFEVEEGVATITLNRPESLNALNQEMGRELLAALRECGSREDIRAVVIKGAGRGFSSGGDIKAMLKVFDQVPSLFFTTDLASLHEVTLAIRELPKPVIAAVHGYAAGAGMNLALACDLRVAAASARFVEAFVNMGLVPDMGGTYFLPRFVGPGKAAELFFTGQPIDADEAHRLGIVNRVVADEELGKAAMDLARQLARGPTLALARTKALLNRAFEQGLARQLDDELQGQVYCSGTEDFQAAVRAFVEKRPVTFKGK